MARGGEAPGDKGKLRGRLGRFPACFSVRLWGKGQKNPPASAGIHTFFFFLCQSFRSVFPIPTIPVFHGFSALSMAVIFSCRSAFNRSGLPWVSKIVSSFRPDYIFAIFFSSLILSISAFPDSIFIFILTMAKNRVFFQFPAVNDSLDQLCRKREQQKAKRCCREQEQNFSHLPNSVKDKAEFCFQKCFHISRSDFRSISSSSIWPHIAPKDAFFMFLSYHVFVILQPSFRIFPQIYTFASSQTFRQAPLFGQKSVKRCNAAYWASRAAHLSRRVSLIFCFVLQ